MTDTTPGLAAPVLDDITPPTVFDIFETDQVAEEQGSWIQGLFGDLADGEVLARGFTSNKSKEVRRKLETAYKKFLKPDGTYPDNIAEQMVIEQLVQALVINWRGSAFTDPKTKQAIPYSPENTRLLVTKLPHFRQRLVAKIGMYDSFRITTQADAEKN